MATLRSLTGSYPFAERTKKTIRAKSSAVFLLFLTVWTLSGLTARAQTLDTVMFGNTTSETAHGLVLDFPEPVTPAATVTAGGGKQPTDPSQTQPSQLITGGLNVTARQLMPRGPNPDVYGGEAIFTMKVDPVQQNYISGKFWGSDTSGNPTLIVDINGLELGARHGGNDFGDTFWSGASNPGRWEYRTDIIPLNLTRGQTSVTVRIRSTGNINDYGNTLPYFGQYQGLMSAPSSGMYNIYTHIGAYLDTTAEQQGTAPTTNTPLTTPTAASVISALESGVDGRMQQYSTSPSTNNFDDLEYMAEAYGTTWSAYKGNAALVSGAISTIDYMVTQYASNSGYAASAWGGSFGPVGDTIRLLWPEINVGNTMSTTVAYGGTLGTVSRTAGWSAALRSSIDSGRFNRQTITNQSIFGGVDIYLANRGLELVQSSNALNESEALRYLYEACGISPWLGNDQPGEGPTPVYGTAPFGPNWYMMTGKGTSKEGGFVGSDYGEVGGLLYRMGLISGDAKLQARALVTYQARSYFRYTGLDTNNYLIMAGAEPIGVRNDGIPGHTAYLGRLTSDDFLTASQGVAVVGANLLGYFQQGVNQGQVWPVVQGTNYGPQEIAETQIPLLPDYWTKASALAQTNVLLPETLNANLPDFAWADEENMVVAAKHGSGSAEESFFLNMNWREPAEITGVAKVWDVTSNQMRFVEMISQDERFTSSGYTVVESSAVDGAQTPEDNPQSAYGGTQYFEAIRPDLTALPSQNQDGGRGTGYSLRWGHWFIGMNAHSTATYAVQMPSDFTSATDLITGQNFSGQVTLQPKTTVVFYLNGIVDPAPAPARVNYLDAAGTNGAVMLSWNAAGAAASYTLKRSATTGGPYTVLAGVTQLSYLDTNVTNGTAYYYVVDAVNAAGVSSGDSVEATATPIVPQTSGLPEPWIDTDIGSTGATGSATISNGTFTLTGSGADIYNSPDEFHFVYVPMLKGSGSIIAKVVSQQNTNANAKAGIMIRTNLTTGSAYVDLVVTPTQVQFIHRGGQNGGSVEVGSTNITAPIWLQLAYNGSNVTASTAPDGVTWTSLGSVSVLPSSNGVPYIGLVDTSHDVGVLSTDVFSNVTVTGLAANDTVLAAPIGLATTVGTGQISLSWTAVMGATGYNVQRSAVSGGPYATISANNTGASYVDSTVVGDATYYYVVSALSSNGQSPISAQVNGQTPGLPPQWISADVGNVGVAGSATESGGVFTLQGSGGDIWFNADAYHFVYAPITGNASITTRVMSQQNTAAYAKAGIMIRNSIAAGGLEVDLVQTPSGIQMDDRQSLNGGTSTVISNGTVSLPYWLRLTYTGTGTFTSYTSPDGSTWTQFGTISLSNWVAGQGEVGLVDSSVNNSELGTDTFDNLSTSGVAMSEAPAGLSANIVGNQVGLNWGTVASATGYNVQRATVSAGPYVMIAANLAANEFVDISSVAGTTYYYTVSSIVGGTQSAASGYVTVQTPGFPPQFASADIGTVGATGSATVNNNIFTVAGSGADIYGTADAFHFVYAPLPASGSIITQIVSLQNTSSDAKGGVMIRGNLTAGSPYVDLVVSPGGGAGMIQRGAEGGNSVYAGSTAKLTLPYWLQLSYAGSTFTGSVSPDGTTWTTVATSTSNLGTGPFYIGLADSSHDAGVLSTDVFANLSTTGITTAPAGMSAAVAGTTVNLSWMAVAGATGYTISRSLVSGGPYTAIASNTTSTTYSDTSGTAGTTYYYVVAAITSSGTSANSGQVAANP